MNGLFLKIFVDLVTLYLTNHTTNNFSTYEKISRNFVFGGSRIEFSLFLHSCMPYLYSRSFSQGFERNEILSEIVF